MYRLYNYDQMIISTSLLSFFSSLLSLLPLFEYAQGRLAPPKGVHLKLSTSMSSKPLHLYYILLDLLILSL